MRIYSLPESTKAIIFDIDGTLYTNEAYVREQVDVQIRHWAEVTGISAQEARDRIAAYRKEWSARHGGKKISLGNTFTAFGVDIKTSIEWRNKIIEPERYLTEDPKLRAALGILSEKCRMVCVTNNPVDAAKRTLRALGVEDMLPLIVGLDTCMASKPSKDMLVKATELSAAKHPLAPHGDPVEPDPVFADVLVNHREQLACRRSLVGVGKLGTDRLGKGALLGEEGVSDAGEGAVQTADQGACPQHAGEDQIDVVVRLLLGAFIGDHMPKEGQQRRRNEKKEQRPDQKSRPLPGSSAAVSAFRHGARMVWVLLIHGNTSE